MVYLLTKDQKNELVGIQFQPYCLFNPIQDANDNWIISQEEVDGCTYEELQWVKTLPLIKFQKQYA